MALINLDLKKCLFYKMSSTICNMTHFTKMAFYNNNFNKMPVTGVIFMSYSRLWLTVLYKSHRRLCLLIKISYKKFLLYFDFYKIKSTTISKKYFFTKRQFLIAICIKCSL